MKINQQLVSDALEHVWDFAYLGRHPLAALPVVSLYVSKDKVLLTHVERGKALSQLLRALINELAHPTPHQHLSHDKRYHDILHHAYVDGAKNREAARRLDISESTFYRERLIAIAIVTRMLVELEGQRAR